MPETYAGVAKRGRPKGSKNKPKSITGGAARFRRVSTKRGAYQPSARRQMANRRRPFVEKLGRDKSEMSHIMTKDPQVTGLYPQPLLPQEVDPDQNGFHLISLDPFNRMTQGFKEYEMTGDSVFSQSLQLKTELSFPVGQDVIIKPFRIYLICGWVTAPYSKTANTLKNVNDVTYNDLNAYIVAQIKEYFDDSLDRLTFNQDIRRNIKIEKYSRCLPTVKETVFGPNTENVTSYATAYGAPAKVERRHTWKINKKIHYTKGKELTDNNTKPSAGDELVQNWYPNESWLPFACYYLPDRDQMIRQDGVVMNPTFRHNVLHVYSDS